MPNYKNFEKPLSYEEKLKRKALKNVIISSTVTAICILIVALTGAIFGAGWGMFSFFSLAVIAIVGFAAFGITMDG